MQPLKSERMLRRIVLVEVDKTLVYNFSQIQTPYGRMAVTYTAGFTTVPEVYKTAIMQQVLYLSLNRGDNKQGMAPLACTLLNPLIRQK